ncbi:MAG: hypothetical protein NT074_04860 [Methanomicrobiales archaeon]|nr:hypothetical protein [Methanomicrobiales archaeon]
MLVHQERIALVLLCIVTVVVVGATLVLNHIGPTPFARTYSPTLADGTLVTLDGTVHDISSTRDGAHSLINVSGVVIFMPNTGFSDRTLHKGDIVTVVGTVSTYQNRKEILVESPSDITVR